MRGKFYFAMCSLMVVLFVGMLTSEIVDRCHERTIKEEWGKARMARDQSFEEFVEIWLEDGADYDTYVAYAQYCYDLRNITQFLQTKELKTAGEIIRILTAHTVS